MQLVALVINMFYHKLIIIYLSTLITFVSIRVFFLPVLKSLIKFTTKTFLISRY